MKTLHVNIMDESNKIYCHKYDKLIGDVDDHLATLCRMCQYFKGFDNSNILTIDCLFDDASDEKEITFDNAGDSEYHSKMQDVRLGRATKNEVINKLKSMNDYSAEMEPEEDDTEGEEKAPDDGGENDS